MSEEIEIFYKNLIFKQDEQVNYLELEIDEVNFSSQESYISSVSIMLEYALSVHPKYIILNREKHPFLISDKLFAFTINNIISPLKLDSVKNIVCIGSEEEYHKRYFEIEKMEPFIKWVDSKYSALQWIKQNEDQFPKS